MKFSEILIVYKKFFKLSFNVKFDPIYNIYCLFLDLLQNKTFVKFKYIYIYIYIYI